MKINFFIGTFIIFAACLSAAGVYASDYSATGDYVQDTDASEPLSDFYDGDTGFLFQGWKTYEKEDFSTMTWTGDNLVSAPANLLLDESNHNLGYSTSIIHEMKEQIYINSEKIWYYESGLNSAESEALKMSLGKGATYYKVEAGFIPVRDISTGTGTLIDTRYKGKFPFMGEEYYFKEYVSPDKLYIAKAMVFDGLSTSTYSSQYNGYSFKVNHLVYDSGYHVTGIILDVKNPGGIVVQEQVTRYANAVVDSLELAALPSSSTDLVSSSIIAYDLGTQVILQNDEDVTVGGVIRTDWQVSFNMVSSCSGDPDCDIAGYGSMATHTDSLLKDVTVTYNHDLVGNESLEPDESLVYPKNFRLDFNGYRKSNFRESYCSGNGNGNIALGIGAQPYQLVTNLTGSNGIRYNNIRLDEGPFMTNDLFMFNGAIYKHLSHSKDNMGPGDTDDIVTVSLAPMISGSTVSISNMQRFCDPEDSGDPSSATYTHRNCEDFKDISLVELALQDALKDSDGKLNNDKIYLIDSYGLFIKHNAFTGYDVLFDDSDNTIFFAQDFYLNGALSDIYLQVNGNMTGTFNGFDLNNNHLSMKILNEGGLPTRLGTGDVNSTSYDASKDYNADGDDDDTLVVYEIMDGPVLVDLSDRDYDQNVNTDYETGIFLDANYNHRYDAGDVKIDDSTDALLIAPVTGDEFALDWGANDRLNGLSLCSPKDHVYSTYFIGTYEGTGGTTTTTSTSTTTSTTSATTTTAGACTIPGDDPPCGEISIPEILSEITKWANGQATISQVLAIITAWATGG